MTISDDQSAPVRAETLRAESLRERR